MHDTIDLSTALLVSTACTVSLIVAIWGCAGCCFKSKGENPRDGSGEAYVSEVEARRSASNFSMFPPVESSPRVFIEPLPDISKLRPNPHTQHANQQRLRPRIGVGTERLETGEDADSGNNVDKTQLLKRISRGNSRYQVPRSQLQYVRELGAGWFGKVIQGEGDQIVPGHRKTKVIIEMLREDADESDQLNFLLESLPYREIDHGNVLKLLGVCVETVPCLVLLEFCHFGDLKSYMQSHRGQVGSFNEKGLVLKFACDIASGLQALHEKNYVHRDLAARNCLLASDLSVKIGDYGLAETIFEEDYYVDKSGDRVPVRWLCPDCVTFDDAGTLVLKPMTKDDNIWTYGVVLWEVVQFCVLPYSPHSSETVISQVLLQRSLTLPRLDAAVLHGDRIHSLVQLCQSERSQRPSLRELKIMLLHLMSYREATDKASDSFQQKWNQLMPRRLHGNAAAAASPAPLSVASLPNTSTPLVGQGQGYGEIVTSDMVQHGRRQRHTSATVVSRISAPSSPVNELSLEDELGGALSFSGQHSRTGVDGFGNKTYEDDRDYTNQTSSWLEITMDEQRGSPTTRTTGHRAPLSTSTPHKSTSSADEEYLVVSRSAPFSSQQRSSTGLAQSSIAALNQHKFSTWLQTVPMSLDADDTESLHDASEVHRSLGESFVSVAVDHGEDPSQHLAPRQRNLSSGDHSDTAIDDH